MLGPWWGTGRDEDAAYFRKLVEASVRFRRSVEAGAEREQLRKDFQDVDHAWQRAVEVLKRIKPRENLYLVRSAAQMDRLHERIKRERLESYCGRVLPVLYEGPSKHDATMLAGRTDDNWVVNFTGDASLPLGSMLNVRIASARHHTLHGEVA